MKKIVLLSLLCVLWPFLASAEIVDKANNLGAYTVGTKETETGLTLQVSSNTPYGVQYRFAQTRVTQDNNVNIKHITVYFEIPPLDLQKPVTPSTIYQTTFSKDMYEKVLITVKTNGATSVGDEEIWSKNKPQQ